MVPIGSCHDLRMDIVVGMHAVIKHHAVVETSVVVRIVAVAWVAVVLVVVIGHITSMMISHMRMRRRVLLIRMIVLRLHGWIRMAVVRRRRMIVLMLVHSMIGIG